MIHVVLPMSGPNLFDPAEFFYPKPLIEIGCKPMIERVVAPFLNITEEVKFHFVVNKDDCTKFSLDKTLRLLTDQPIHVTQVAQPTAGAPCTILLLVDEIDFQDEILISNSDSILDLDIEEKLNRFRKEKNDAAVLTHNSIHPRWSYVRIDGQNQVLEAAEKQPISRHAIVGLYYYQRFGQFVDAATCMIKKDIRYNNQFYLSLTLNEYVLNQQNVEAYSVDSQHCHILHSPSRLKEYERQLLGVKKI